MELTRKQAIEEHRKMWNWIADEILRTKSSVDKEQYLSMIKSEALYNNCFLCEYSKNYMDKLELSYLDNTICNYCPLEWGYTSCMGVDDEYPLYLQFITCRDKCNRYEELANIARQIANLPEREDLSNAESCN